MKFKLSDNKYGALSENCLVSETTPQEILPVATPPKQERLDINTAHERWGHCGEGMLRRTATSYSVKLYGKLHMCEVCVLSKSNQLPKKKYSNLPVHDILDVVQIDLQGPFPLTAVDGTNTNMKLIDGFSGYIKMETIHHKSSATTADVLRRYMDRMKLRTGKNFNIIAVDQGTEFDGEFFTLVKTMGLTKLKATAYKHHLPPKAERANQTLLKFGRALLLASRLPANFYSEAQLTACYILNRLVHAGETKSPYEIMYGTRPKLRHFHPFGTICYVFVPPERRTKLDNVREKGRLIGFGDDDSSEEIRGYKVVIENGSKMVWSNDVIFDVKHEFEPLPSATAALPSDLDLLESEDNISIGGEPNEDDASHNDDPANNPIPTEDDSHIVDNEPVHQMTLRDRPTVFAASARRVVKRVKWTWTLSVERVRKLKNTTPTLQKLTKRNTLPQLQRTDPGAHRDTAQFAQLQSATHG